MKISSTVPFCVVAVLSFGCATPGGAAPDRSAGVSPSPLAGGGAKKVVTFKPHSEAMRVGAKEQRSQRTTIDVSMNMESGGMHITVPMRTDETESLVVEKLSASQSRVTFQEKRTVQKFGDEPPAEEREPVHGKTYLVDTAAAQQVRTAEGQVVEGAEAAIALAEAPSPSDDLKMNGAEVSFEMHSEIPLLKDMVVSQFAAGAGGKLDAERVSVQLIEETRDTGIFGIAVRGTLRMAEGSMDVDLTGKLEMTLNGMAPRSLLLEGPVKLTMTMDADTGPVQVVATGRMKTQLDVKQL